MKIELVAVLAGLVALACGDDGGAPPVDEPSESSATICGVSFDDVDAAWSDFAPATTISVCAGGGCDAETVEEGVDLACEAGAGDADVAVEPGRYDEAIYVDCPGVRLRVRAVGAPATGVALAGADPAARAILDGAYRAADACSGDDEHGALQLGSARAFWLEGFEVRGYRRACDEGTAYGVVVDAAGVSAVRVRANWIHDLGVGCPGGAATCDGDLNGHGVLVIGTRPGAIERVAVTDNLVEDLALGRSEAIALNGHVTRFVVARNIVRRVDNIGIDVIGFENGQAYQARLGVVRDNVVETLVCGNPTYASDTDNDLCPGGGPARWPAAAGIYVDGAAGVCVVANTVTGFDRGLEVAAERGGGGDEASGIALCGNVLEASREHAITYGGSCNGGASGASDVRIVGNVAICAPGDDACVELDRADACTTAPLCDPVAGCGASPVAGAPIDACG